MLGYRAIKGRDAVSHLKKDFKYHKLFDNKYAEQSYIAYLSKNKRKYVMNSVNVNLFCRFLVKIFVGFW